ncbi:MAG TPA: glycine zipper family protein [Stellaceae bacterium]|nr:glycine zipper family protein [Stellaceae bacterium]
MRRYRLTRWLAVGGLMTGLFALGACAVAPPMGPSILASPPSTKPPEIFQQDDAGCRQVAATQTGISPADAAAQSQINSAALGTVLGAGLGAAIGAAAGNPAMGAAIGAGSGALLGTAQGAGAAAFSGASVQQHYDLVYAQCMASRGNLIQQPFAGGGGFPAQDAFGGGFPVAPYPFGSPYFGPYGYGPAFVGVGVGGWGCCWNRGWRWRRWY